MTYSLNSLKAKVPHVSQGCAYRRSGHLRWFSLLVVSREQGHMLFRGYIGIRFPFPANCQYVRVLGNLSLRQRVRSIL